MVQIILAGVVVIIAATLIFAATKPATFRVRRSANVKAPPERIFPHISDFRNWGAWSPWEKLDPDLKRSHSGALTGKGAIYEWEGNKKVGSGRMEILSSSPSSLLSIKLDFFRPFESHCTTGFTLEPRAEGTNVTWSMEGPNTYMTKLMTVFMSMDSMVGKDYERGLAGLKRVSEAEATVSA